MAKTTIRPKPAPSRTTEPTGSAAPDGAADIQMIPLDQLEPSPLNVRRVAASASDDAELLASIRETGIKRNLALKLSQYPFSHGEPGSMYAVFAPTAAIQSRTFSAINSVP